MSLPGCLHWHSVAHLLGRTDHQGEQEEGLAQCEVHLGSQGSFLAGRSLQGLDKVELVSVLTGKNGRFLVVLDELVHSVETPLPNAVHAIAALHLEVLVLAWRLQGDGEVAWLTKETQAKMSTDMYYIITNIQQFIIL